MEREEVGAIVNLTRGEEESDFAVHRSLIDFGNHHGVHCSYVSSLNACDAQLLHDHRESDLPSAQTGYGKFKARCERALMESSKRFSIFRFFAIHGWAPNRCARTEEFLKKLFSREKVTVPQRIIQNRTWVMDLAGMLAALIIEKGEGVSHLGTVDASDEIEFLRKLAQAFGYEDSCVMPGEGSPTNAYMVPERIFKMFGQEFRRTENDTIAGIVGTPELAPYRSDRREKG